MHLFFPPYDQKNSDDQREAKDGSDDYGSDIRESVWSSLTSICMLGWIHSGEFCHINSIHPWGGGKALRDGSDDYGGHIPCLTSICMFGW